MKLDIDEIKKVESKKSIYDKLCDSMSFQLVFTAALALLGLYIGLCMLSSTNPTITFSENITISERQVLARNYYVITPENDWYLVDGYNNTYNKLQPGHTYSVIIRKSVYREFNTNGMTPDQIEYVKKMDMETRFGYTGKMIVGVNGEIR
jgi:hypothetical protein